MPGNKSARIDCTVGSFWVTPKIFWRWVREGVVEFEGEHPLTGRYRGGTDDFQVTLSHMILDLTCPEHLHEVLQSQRRRRA